MIKFDTNISGNIICPICSISKPKSDYPIDKSHNHGFRNQCKKCHSSINESRRKFKYHNNNEFKLKVKSWQKKYYSTKKPYVRKYACKKNLLDYFGGKCTICGYNNCKAALEFHHKDPKAKEFNLSNISVNPNSWKKCIEEAAKCILICNRCHREIHHKENELLYEQILQEHKDSKK